MPKIVVRSDRAPAPVAAYSQAVRAGDFLFLSGQIPIDPATGEMVSGSIELETRRVLDNLAHASNARHQLLSASSRPDLVVQVIHESGAAVG